VLCERQGQEACVSLDKSRVTAEVLLIRAAPITKSEMTSVRASNPIGLVVLPILPPSTLLVLTRGAVFSELGYACPCALSTCWFQDPE